MTSKMLKKLIGGAFVFSICAMSLNAQDTQATQQDSKVSKKSMMKTEAHPTKRPELKEQNQNSNQRSHGKKSAEDRAKDLTTKMTQNFGLTREQSPKVHALNLELFNTVKTLRHSRMEEKSKMKAMSEYLQTYRNSMGGILDKKQFGQFNQMMDKMQERMMASISGKKKGHEMDRKEYQSERKVEAGKSGKAGKVNVKDANRSERAETSDRTTIDEVNVNAEEKAIKFTQKMTEKLGLTREQSPKVQELNLELFKMAELLQQSRMEESSKKAALNKQLVSYRSKMSRILDKRQLGEFEAMFERLEDKLIGKVTGKKTAKPKSRQINPSKKGSIDGQINRKAPAREMQNSDDQ